MIRLSILILLLLLSLLAVLKAPTYHLWLMAVAVTEFPLIFVGCTLLMLATGFWVTKYQLPGTIIGTIALLLLLSPIFRSYLVSRNLKENLKLAFGTPGIKNDAQPFSFGKLFKLSYKDVVPSHSITYVSYQDTSLSLDFFPSQAIGKRPCVIVVHGGSWSSGDSKQLADLNSYLARKGYNVAALNYRLAPKCQTPAPVEDIRNALNYLHKRAGELNIDTNNFVLLGRSAGAQIALLATYTLHNEGLKGVIDFYGPADMVWGYSVPSNPLVMNSRKVMEDYIGGPYSKIPGKYEACSPILFVDKTSLPTLIIHGTNDVLVSDEHSRRLNIKLQENGIKHYKLVLPWATHGFDFNLYGPGGQLSTYAIEEFLNAVTK
ncbi:MAG TPA: alpha/beta hydrolase [Mucilaginibacter sp.]|jgi:acetyl esterase/lipase|nr:alpha/beta hydrolase [Mucilaginibacter sp.]